MSGIPARQSQLAEGHLAALPRETEPNLKADQWALPVIFVIIVALALAAITIAFAVEGYPLPRIDAVGFLATAITYAGGNGFRNFVNPMTNVIDKSGAWRSISHGWMYPRAIAALCTTPDAMSAYRADGIIGALAIISSATCSLVFVRVFTGKVTWLQAFATAFGLLYFTTFLQTTAGRPEGLVTVFFTSAAIFVALLKPNNWSLDLILGFVAGLSATASPVACVLAVLVSLVVMFWRYEFARAVGHISVVCVATLVSFLLLFALSSPNPFWTWWTGTRALSAAATGGFLPGSILKFWLTDAEAPCLALGPLLFGFALAKLYLKSKPAKSNRCFLMSVAALLFAILHYCVFISFRRYNILPLLPLLQAAGIVVLSGPLVKVLGWRFSKACLYLSCFFGALTGVGLGRELLLLRLYAKSGTHLEQARSEFAAILSSYPDGTIGVSNSLWCLSEQYRRMLTDQTDQFLDVPGRAPFSVLVVQQNGYNAVIPPERPGFRIASSSFNSGRPKFLGLGLGHTFPGYQFAVYVREKDAATKD